MLTSMALEVIKSSEIEGEILNLNQVRSSLAKRLGFDITTSVPVSRYIDGVVDPSQKYLWGIQGAQVNDRKRRHPAQTYFWQALGRVLSITCAGNPLQKHL